VTAKREFAMSLLIPRGGSIVQRRPRRIVGPHARGRCKFNRQNDRDSCKRRTCHPNHSVSKPPSTGPAALVSDDAVAQTPIAAVRSSLGKVAPTSARLAGVSSTAAMPCNTRAPMSEPMDPESAHPIDAAPNRKQPICSTRALPYVSARAPPIRVKLAKTST
jgi:hypothetical protein